MSNPRLYVFERVNPGEAGVAWIVELRNDGLTPANILRFSIMVDGKELSRPTMENPATVWFRALQSLGFRSLGELRGQLVSPPAAIPDRKVELLFSVVILDPREQVQGAMRRLGAEIEYESVWKERFRYVHTFGEGV